jgi:hypothetical protein
MITFAIVKASYSWVPVPTSPDPNVRRPDAVGGYCGAAFFVNSNTVVSANHVLTGSTFSPDHGRSHAQVWLISPDNHVIEIDASMLSSSPELDLAVLEVPDKVPESAQVSLAPKDPNEGEKIYNEGYPDSGQPDLDLQVVNPPTGQPKIALTGGDLSSAVFRRDGTVSSVGKETVMANDMTLRDVMIVRTDYGGPVGMSGGPLIRKRDQNVVGFMSHGYPPDATRKKVLCAVSVTEFANHL